MARIPTPKRLVSAPRAMPIPTPIGNLANAAAAGQIGQLAQQHGEYFYNVAAKEAERRGLEAANSFIFDKDPETGEIVPPKRPTVDGKLVPNIYDQAYRRQITDRHQTELILSGQKAASELADKHRLDPESFDASWQTYKDEVIKTVPKDMQGSVDTALSQLGVPYSNRIATKKSELEYQKTLNISLAQLDSTMANIEEIITSGGSEQEVGAALDVFIREVAAYSESGILDPKISSDVERVLGERIAFADVARNLFYSGKAAGHASQQAHHKAIQQQILDGTYEINALGKKRQISEVLTAEERARVATRIGQYSAMEAQKRALRIEAAKEFYTQNIHLPRMLHAVMTGEQTAVDDVLTDAERYAGQPELIEHVLASYSRVQGVASQRQHQLSLDIQTDALLNSIDSITTPELEKQYQAMYGENLPRAIEVARSLNGRFSEAAHDWVTRTHTQLKALTTGVSTPEHVKEVNRKITELAIQTQGSPYAEQQKLDLTDKQRTYFTGSVDTTAAARAGMNSFSWAASDEQSVIAQSDALGKYRRFGQYSDAYIENLKAYLHSEMISNPETQHILSLYRGGFTNPDGSVDERAKAILGNTLGADTTKALEIISNSYEIAGNSPGMFDLAVSARDGNYYIEEIYQEQAQAAASDPESNVAEDMDSTVHGAVFGDQDKFFGLSAPDELPMQSKGRSIFRANFATGMSIYSGNVKAAGNYAIERMKLIDGYVPSQLGWSTERVSALQHQGWADSLGRGNAPVQYLHKSMAPEAVYPDVTESISTVEALTAWAEREASRINPDIDWKAGVNLYLEPSSSIGPDGKPRFWLYAPSGISNEATPLSMEPLSFGTYFNTLKTLSHNKMEALTDAKRELRQAQAMAATPGLRDYRVQESGNKALYEARKKIMEILDRPELPQE